MVGVWDLERGGHLSIRSECYVRICELKGPVLFFISSLSGAEYG